MNTSLVVNAANTKLYRNKKIRFGLKIRFFLQKSFLGNFGNFDRLIRKKLIFLMWRLGNFFCPSVLRKMFLALDDNPLKIKIPVEQHTL